MKGQINREATGRNILRCPQFNAKSTERTGLCSCLGVSGTRELMLKATVTPKPERAGTRRQPDRGPAVNTQPSGSTWQLQNGTGAPETVNQGDGVERTEGSPGQVPGKGPFEEMPREQASKATKASMRLRRERSSQAKALGLERVWLVGGTERSAWIQLSPHRPGDPIAFGGQLPDPPIPILALRNMHPANSVSSIS